MSRPPKKPMDWTNPFIMHWTERQMTAAAALPRTDKWAAVYCSGCGAPLWGVVAGQHTIASQRFEVKAEVGPQISVPVPVGPAVQHRRPFDVACRECGKSNRLYPPR